MNIEQLRDIAVGIIDQQGATLDSADIAKQTANAIPDAELRDVVGLLMHHFIRQVLRTGHRGYIPASPSTAAGADAPARPKHVPTPGPSASNRARQAWDAKLELFVSVEGKSLRKRLGDCGLGDVQMIANLYKRRSSDMLDRHRWYACVANAMNAVGVQRVRDLPEGTLRPMLEQLV